METFITKEEYYKIVGTFKNYISACNKIYLNNSKSDDFYQGLLRGLELIEIFVIKD